MNRVQISQQNHKIQRQKRKQIIRDEAKKRGLRLKDKEPWTASDCRELLDFYFGYFITRPMDTPLIGLKICRSQSSVETMLSCLNKNLRGVTEKMFMEEEHKGTKVEIDGRFAHWNPRMDRFLKNWLDAMKEQHEKTWSTSRHYRIPTLYEIASMLRKTSDAVQRRITYHTQPDRGEGFGF